MAQLTSRVGGYNVSFCLHKTPLSSENHEASITRISSMAGTFSWFGLAVRSAAADWQNCYFAFCMHGGDSNYNSYIYKRVDGVETALAGPVAGLVTNMRLTVTGANPATITLYSGVDQILQTTDSDHDVGGYVGFASAVGANAIPIQLDDWSAAIL